MFLMCISTPRGRLLYFKFSFFFFKYNDHAMLLCGDFVISICTDIHEKFPKSPFLLTNIKLELRSIDE